MISRATGAPPPPTASQPGIGQLGQVVLVEAGERVTSASLARLAQHLLGECGQAESQPRRLVDTSGGGPERGPIRIAWCDTRGSDHHEIVNESESGEGQAEPA